MVAHGVPLITSHRGGAKELGGDNPSFVFKASDKEALIEIWRQLVDGELQPGDYWATAMSLTTMDDHLNRLMELWANPEAPLLDHRGRVDPSGHKTHIQEIVEDDDDEYSPAQGRHLDVEGGEAGSAGSPRQGEQPVGEGHAGEGHAGEGRVGGEYAVIEPPESDEGAMRDSDPATQAANSIPEALKEAAATYESRAGQPLDNDEDAPLS